MGVTIAKAPALVLISDLNVVWSGSPQGATITTTPGSLGYVAMYTGVAPTSYVSSATQPTDPGTYAVSVTVTSANYVGTGSGTFTINNTAATSPSTVNPLYDFSASHSSMAATVIM